VDGEDGGEDGEGGGGRGERDETRERLSEGGRQGGENGDVPPGCRPRGEKAERSGAPSPGDGGVERPVALGERAGEIDGVRDGDGTDSERPDDVGDGGRGAAEVLDPVREGEDPRAQREAEREDDDVTEAEGTIARHGTTNRGRGKYLARA
jgi:hypothetical protein